MIPTQATFEARARDFHDRVKSYQNKGLRVFATSSFQTQSLPLLHMVSGLETSIPIYVTNTGFLFPETLSFINRLRREYSLDVRSIYSDVPMSGQRDHKGSFYYASDPNYCCNINKTLPLKKVIEGHDIWINGVRKDQSNFRAELSETEETEQGCKRVHPMLEWTAKDVFYYRKVFDLPKHPLDESGFASIGCQPCTKLDFCEQYSRNGRWAGQNKNECGIVSDLIAKG